MINDQINQSEKNFLNFKNLTKEIFVKNDLLENLKILIFILFYLQNNLKSKLKIKEILENHEEILNNYYKTNKYDDSSKIFFDLNQLLANILKKKLEICDKFSHLINNQYLFDPFFENLSKKKVQFRPILIEEILEILRSCLYCYEYIEDEKKIKSTFIKFLKGYILEENDYLINSLIQLIFIFKKCSNFIGSKNLHCKIKEFEDLFKMYFDKNISWKSSYYEFDKEKLNFEIRDFINEIIQSNEVSKKFNIIDEFMLINEKYDHLPILSDKLLYEISIY